ncbi:NACHT domain-containing protein [Pseudorhodoferax soli]|uniref:NACHT domain-containing protein n=1 Tax=Pseudorhodoferax soli TaxID=545864 RepID=A0A368XN62_9BURK|nr:NACHT domain-containing protein [Pseudorhodoferax soli]RCW69441.1 NACHT domain-containing protein [Pseudorhodoferax soli]
MSSINGLDPSFYCLPVELIDGVFRQKKDSALGGSDLPTVRDLSSILSARYVKESGRLVIGERLYAGPVLVHRDGKGHSYALVDSGGKPVGAAHESGIVPEHVQSIAKRAMPLVSRSEALTPFESVDLRNAFIEPEFAEFAPDGTVISRRSWWSVLSETRAIIFGAPGSGKSTCLRRMALECERGEEDDPARLPVYMQLRHIQSSNSLEEAARSLFAGPPLLLETDTSQSIGEGADYLANALLLLDGLDEVPTHLQDEVLASMQGLAASGTAAAIFISTRERGYEWRIPGFKYFKLLPLPDSKVREWVYYRLTAEPPVPWRQFIASFEHSPKIRELCSNPLLLSIAVSAYRRSATLPASKAVLLESCLDAVTDRWDSTRGVVRDSQSWASPKMKVAALSRTAFFLHGKQGDLFTLEDFCSWNRPLGADRNLLLALQRHTGLVTQVGSEDRWSFAHRTIADYLTARFVVFDTDDSAKTLRGLMKHERWRDVWSYSCGIAHDATPLILMVLHNETFTKRHRFDAIADAFSQELFCSDDASELALKEVKAFLSSALRPLLLSQRSRTVTTRVALVRKFRFEDEQRNSAATEAKSRLLVNVVGSLSALRRGVLGERLVSWLEKSKHEAMRTLAALLDKDAALSANASVENGRVHLTVVQDRPNFQLEAIESRPDAPNATQR